MSTTLEALEAAYVAQKQRVFHSGTRAVATPEQRQAWEQEFRDAIAQAKAEAQVEVLREAADDWHEEHVGTRPVPYKWLHGRADRIAREAGIETGGSND